MPNINSCKCSNVKPPRIIDKDDLKMEIYIKNTRKGFKGKIKSEVLLLY